MPQKKILIVKKNISQNKIHFEGAHIKAIQRKDSTKLIRETYLFLCVRE